MKRKTIFRTSLAVALILVSISCSTDNSGENETLTPNQPTEPETTVLDDFWFGYYQEDAITNPEDPLPGFIYLNIPDNGTFDGELLFSYSGCVGGVDVGRASGSAIDGSLMGTWSGTVDGVSVGGEYAGTLSDDELTISGAYSNEEGKVEIECDPDFSYFVAPRGSLFLQRTGDNSSLNILIEAESDPLRFTWNGVTGVGVFYSLIVVDAACLEQEVDIRDCLMWSGISNAESIVYGEGIGETVPAESLVDGDTYLATVSAINDSGEVLATSNITFVF